MQEREKERRPQRQGAGPAQRPRGGPRHRRGQPSVRTGLGARTAWPALRHRADGAAAHVAGISEAMWPSASSAALSCAARHLQEAHQGPCLSVTSFPLARATLSPPRAEETPGQAGMAWVQPGSSTWVELGKARKEKRGRHAEWEESGAPRRGAGRLLWPQGTSAPARGPTKPCPLRPDARRESRLGTGPCCPLQAHSCPRGLHCLRGPLQTTQAAGRRPHPGLWAPSLPPARRLTEGGGDSRPMRGVFSQRGFWKLAFWLLRHEERRAVTAGRCGPSPRSEALFRGQADWRPPHPARSSSDFSGGGVHPVCSPHCPACTCWQGPGGVP